jgi:two-component system chemotaxis sensor kinase CheA
MFRHLRGIAGSTILGSGDVALILDVAALVQSVTQSEQQRLSERSLAAPAVLSNNPFSQH